MNKMKQFIFSDAIRHFNRLFILLISLVLLLLNPLTVFSAENTSDLTAVRSDQNRISSAFSGQTALSSAVSEQPDPVSAAYGQSGSSSMPSEREQVLPDPTVPEDFSLILVDDESVRVEICRIRTDSAGTYIWDMYCANKSEDSDYLFLAEDVSINGVMCDPSWGRRIQAGRDGRSAMQWTEGRLMTSQIKDVTEVTLTLKVTNETNPTLPPI